MLSGGDWDPGLFREAQEEHFYRRFPTRGSRVRGGGIVYARRAFFKPLLLPPKPRRFRYPGRKPLDNRKVMTGILFVLKNAWCPVST